ncbi:hypothetical protein [Pseudomonas putida]|uniref:hypothetical protein n=1 Tax=Pseudomonas putida TaxID=303 RepID=UPI0023633172|nr:hypothetical protein [Pseudomonas putida]MDD2002491.1 hypothetical protein [Pseudomonas putida]
MPTENRSINTEMVSEPFQREERYVVIKVSKMHPHPAFRAKHLSALKREHEDALVDCVVVERDWPEYEPTWAAIEARVTGQPAPQPHPEPMAWMVGTAFWWTREEAERDAAATGLPIVGLGPMTDSTEVERLRVELGYLREERDDLSARLDRFYSRSHGIKNLSAIEQLNDKLAERDTLLRDNSGKLIRMAAHLISAPLFALQDLQDEDKKMTRARVDKAVDTADARLKDAAYELRRIADALSASAEPQVKP